jgi:hypothetical protein
MPPSVTVKAVRAEEKARFEQAALTAQQQLAGVDAALASAQIAVRAATTTLGDLQAAEARLRQQLAVASMPADIDTLEQELEANLLAQRPAAAALSEAQDLVATKTRERQRVSTAVTTARAGITAAGAVLASATQDDDQATLWRAAIDAGVPQAVVTTAKGQPVTTLVADATSNLKTWLGKPELFDLLQSRFTDAATAAADRDDAVTRAIDAHNAVLAARSTIDGAVRTTAEAYLRARAAARAVVDQADQQLGWAEKVLAVAAGDSPLTASEQTRIDDRAKVATAGGATNPAGRAKAVHDAAVTNRAAAAAYEAKILPKQAVDPTYNPTADDTVKTERDAAEQASEDLNDAAKALTAAMRDKLDQWEVALPPVLVSVAVDTLRALAIVDRLANDTDPGKLEQALDTAEEAYAKALRARDANETLLTASAARVAQRRDEAAALAPVSDLRVAAFVRGDK